MTEAPETLAIRRSPEVDAVRTATKRMPIGQVDALRAAILGMADPDSTMADECLANDDQLHLALADASGHSRLTHDLQQHTRLFALRRIPGRFAVGKAEHRAILDAVAVRDSTRAAVLMHRHLKCAGNANTATLSGPHR